MTDVNKPSAPLKKGVVYLATNLVNGKKYVGITSRPLNVRISEHLYDSKYNTKHTKLNYFHNAIQKYGIENFSFDVLETVQAYTIEELKCQLFDLEYFYIELYHCNDKSVGYNLTKGGQGALGCKLTPEHRKKIGDRHRGKHLSEEHKRRISEFMRSENNPNRGKHHTVAARLKMSLSTKRRFGAENPMYGVKRPDLSQRNLLSSKRVCQIDIQTGEILKIWDSLHEAARVTGYNRQCITACCYHKSKASHGYRWEFDDTIQQNLLEPKGE